MCFAVAACIGMFMSMPGGAAPPKDNLVITGLTDTNGFTPTLQGNSSQYFYAATIPANTVFANTIPIQFDLNDTDGQAGELYTVTFNAAGQAEIAISFDLSSFDMTDPSSATHYAYIHTEYLPAGDYHANVQINATPANGVDVTHGTLHLLIHVVEVNAAPHCYVTDSSGLLLSDCSGNEVYTGGEFLLVANQKKITATNPGQFYFNFLWTNETGSDVTFTSLGLNGNNVVPQGANSVHVLIYNASSFTASFDDVNRNGIACGTTGSVCKSAITVPAGETLWLTWHVSYQWLGSPLWPEIPPAGPAACGGSSEHGTIRMSAMLQNANVSLSCSTSANGQNIK
jgi:hypothetical protein